jgi:hypothetical protein
MCRSGSGRGHASGILRGWSRSALACEPPAARLVAQASDSERFQAAIVLWAAGNLERLLSSVHLAEVDWRDVLLRGGLEHDDWRDRLDSELGPTR